MVTSVSFVLLLAQATRVLAVGDSWAYGAEAPLETAFLNHGYPADVVSIGVPGSHASVWATSGGCSTIQSWLAAFPSIDIVHVEVGVNDLLGAWDASMTAAQTDALAASIALDVQAIADCAQAAAPNVEVVTRCYDFPNFQRFARGQCGTLWAQTGQPTPAQMNAALLALDAALAQRALWDPRWVHVGAQGSTQSLGGGSPDPAAVSPSALMFDCLHLGPAASDFFAEAAWLPFYAHCLAGYYSPSFSGLVPGAAGVTNTLTTTEGFPMEQVAFVYALNYNPTPAPACPGMIVLSPWPALIGAPFADAAGNASYQVFVPAELAGIPVWTQALLPNICLGTQAGKSLL